MGDITQNEQDGVRTGKATAEAGLKISRSGGKSNTTLTKQDIEKLEALSKEEALARVCEQLAATLVLYQNLGGSITAVTLPENKQILGRREVIILPAVKDNSGTYSLYVPEAYQNGSSKEEP